MDFTNYILIQNVFYANPIMEILASPWLVSHVMTIFLLELIWVKIQLIVVFRYIMALFGEDYLELLFVNIGNIWMK